MRTETLAAFLAVRGLKVTRHKSRVLIFRDGLPPETHDDWKVAMTERGKHWGFEQTFASNAEATRWARGLTPKRLSKIILEQQGVEA